MRKMCLLLAAPALAAALPLSPAGALPVFDATNYSQNLLQAARALEQVNHQVQSLQNEAAMLRNMATNLKRIDFPEVRQLTGTLQRIDRLIGEAHSIDLKVDGLDERFRAMFPGAAGAPGGTAAQLEAARARLEAAEASYRETLRVQAGIAEAVRDDGALLGGLVERAQGAEGSLQAQQATNQLLALGAKQQMQVQALLAAYQRSETLDRARRTQAELDAQAATRRFLGTGRAYTRQP
jgi:P-type conjugative transfer protein TrbJ